MGSLVYLAALIAFALLIHWTVTNDNHAKNGGKTRGIYAMKEEGGPEPEEDT